MFELRSKTKWYCPPGKWFYGPTPLPSGISWASDPPTPLEFPIPSVVGVWIFSGTTHCRTFHFPLKDLHQDRHLMGQIYWVSFFHQQVSFSDCLTVRSTTLKRKAAQFTTEKQKSHYVVVKNSLILLIVGNSFVLLAYSFTPSKQKGIWTFFIIVIKIAMELIFERM